MMMLPSRRVHLREVRNVNRQVHPKNESVLFARNLLKDMKGRRPCTTKGFDPRFFGPYSQMMVKQQIQTLVVDAKYEMKIIVH